MSCELGQVTVRLENDLCSFSNISVTSPTSQLILQPSRRFTYVTAHSLTPPLLDLRHSSFSNPSFTSPTLQALHLIHLASRPWVVNLSTNPPSWRTTPEAVRDCLFNVFAATLHIWRPSPLSATWGRAMPWGQGPTNTAYSSCTFRKLRRIFFFSTPMSLCTVISANAVEGPNAKGCKCWK